MNIIDSPKNDNKEVSTDLPPLAVLETSQIVVSETTEEKNENPVEKNEIPVEKNEIPVEKNENHDEVRKSERGFCERLEEDRKLLCWREREGNLISHCPSQNVHRTV